MNLICHRRFVPALPALLALLLCGMPRPVLACAACFGQSDSPMAKGMNAGIFMLLLVITSVLLGIGIFFVYILRRASRLASQAAAASVLAAPGISPGSSAAAVSRAPSGVGIEPISQPAR